MHSRVRSERHLTESFQGGAVRNDWEHGANSPKSKTASGECVGTLEYARV